jgi:chromosome segregation protein
MTQRAESSDDQRADGPHPSPDELRTTAEHADDPEEISGEERRVVELEAKLARRDVQLAEAEAAITEAADGMRPAARHRLLKARSEVQQAYERLEREVTRRMSLEREVERQIRLRQAERQKRDRGIARMKAQLLSELESARAQGDTDIDELRRTLSKARAEARTALDEGRAAAHEARSLLDEERARRQDLERRLEAVTSSHTADARDSESRGRELEVLRSELEHAVREQARLRSELRRLSSS